MEFIKLVFSALGGGVTVAIIVLAFMKDRMEKYVDKKIDFQFDSKLEKEKGIIGQKMYVSQHKFDKEYKIIEELMEKSYDFTYLTWNAYCNIGDKDDSDMKKYIEHCDEFTLFYMKNCAFIPKELAELFDLFVKKINDFRSALRNYKELLTRVMKNNCTSKEDDKLFQSYADTMKTIHDEINKTSNYSHEQLVKKTREYYERLEIK